MLLLLIYVHGCVKIPFLDEPIVYVVGALSLFPQSHCCMVPLTSLFCVY